MPHTSSNASGSRISASSRGRNPSAEAAYNTVDSIRRSNNGESDDPCACLLKNIFIFMWGYALLWLSMHSDTNSAATNGSGGGLPVPPSLVSVPAYNKSFAGMPALFGHQWSTSSMYARLQVIPERPFMCADEVEGPLGAEFSKSGRDGNSSGLVVPAGNGTPPLAAASKKGTHGGNRTTVEYDDESLPVAVLIQRGHCTFYEKAVMAAKYYPTVEYVVVFDNEISNALIPMSTEDELPSPAEELKLLFVGYRSGTGASPGF